MQSNAFALNMINLMFIKYCLSVGFIGETSTSFEGGVSGELFALLAECETERQPGRELLSRAKVLRWPLLAIVASCFPDVTPLSCLTTWLELTAARFVYKCIIYSFQSLFILHSVTKLCVAI